MNGTTGVDMRTRALIGVGVTILIGIAGWIWLSRIADSGLDRLAAIDRVRAQCESAWASATTKADSVAVDQTALKDTIDARSETALRRCGDLRTKTVLPPAREMTGQPMPRGLR